MSRHWHNIKDSKGKLDSKRAAKFTIFGRMITLAAKERGGDPAMNPKLRNAIEKAKAAFTPKDVIERAIKKGTGELESEQLEELIYEGYGPGGAAVLVESLTDNRNRTGGNIKHLFGSNGGNLGAANSVAWMFERKGAIAIPAASLEGKDLDDVELRLIEAGAEDITREPEGWTVFTPFNDLQSVRENIEAAGFKAESAELEYVAKDPLALPEEQKQALLELLDALEGDEDVRAVYTNVEI